jgi:hypothetical protein
MPEPPAVRLAPEPTCQTPSLPATPRSSSRRMLVVRNTGGERTNLNEVRPLTHRGPAPAVPLIRTISNSNRPRMCRM